MSLSQFVAQRRESVSHVAVNVVISESVLFVLWLAEPLSWDAVD
jgi:hypothetical protein